MVSSTSSLILFSFLLMSPLISQWVGQSITSQTSPFLHERSWSLLHGSSPYHQKKKNPNKKPSIPPQKTPYTINKHIGLPTHKPLRTPLAADHGPYMKSHCIQNSNIIPDITICSPNTHILVTNCIYSNVILGNLSIKKKQDFHNYKTEK